MTFFSCPKIVSSFFACSNTSFNNIKQDPKAFSGNDGSDSNRVTKRRIKWAAEERSFDDKELMEDSRTLRVAEEERYSGVMFAKRIGKGMRSSSLKMMGLDLDV